MNNLNIDIKEDRQVTISEDTGGNIYENNATVLRITIPQKYSSYYKYMDIIKDNKEKTQTVISVKDEYILSYPLPDDLTGSRELVCQLVLKNEAEVFKSNMFILSFSGSINATQYIENKCADTIEYLMENKADKDKLSKLNDTKLEKSVFYSFRDTQDVINNLKADKEEMNNLLAGKVNKEDGKGLSSNDYTDEEKEKLRELPDSEELYNHINLKADSEEVNEKLGDIEEALDKIIEIQNELIHGNVGSGGDVEIMPLEVSE